MSRDFFAKLKAQLGTAEKAAKPPDMERVTCPCGAWKVKCATCGEWHCRAPGHALHVCRAPEFSQVSP